MIFNEHSELEGRHAFLGASKWHWLDYDDETLYSRMISSWSTAVGDAMHELACKLIIRRMKLAKSDKKLCIFYLSDKGIPRFAYDIDILFPNFMTYVNDAIGFRMSPEVVLKYSRNCFGTTDAICFRDNFLRIHDYKSGTTPAHIEQLKIYAGLFCHEYKNDIQFDKFQCELRIYQNDQVMLYTPSNQEIADIMNRIAEADKFVENVRISEG